jgi:hypothetical protein
VNAPRSYYIDTENDQMIEIYRYRYTTTNATRAEELTPTCIIIPDSAAEDMCVSPVVALIMLLLLCCCTLPEQERAR